MAGQYTPHEKMIACLQEFIDEAERHSKTVYSKWTGNTWQFDREHWERTPDYQRVIRAKETIAEFKARF